MYDGAEPQNVTRDVVGVVTKDIELIMFFGLCSR